jgi:hypothetical protein
MRLTNKNQIALVKQKILESQGLLCALCGIRLFEDDTQNLCLDHDHKTGHIRGVLCRNCNSIEGKVFNLANRAKRSATPAWWISKLLAYWKQHTENPSNIYHSTHKTDDQKREIRNKKAREARAKKAKK